ncbi:MAG: hypothetical protein EA001_02980 [Oscillatoriales cyanobacterium]|nr:MAG: hypothetical protein EA001_02980 [Oscillatoriales cyanobacterium]
MHGANPLGKNYRVRNASPLFSDVADRFGRQRSPIAINCSFLAALRNQSSQTRGFGPLHPHDQIT